MYGIKIFYYYTHQYENVITNKNSKKKKKNIAFLKILVES